MLKLPVVLSEASLSACASLCVGMGGLGAWAGARGLGCDESS